MIMKEELTPSTVFSSMAVLEELRIQLARAFHFLSQMISGKVSLDRVSNFLNNTELLGIHEKGSTSWSVQVPSHRANDIGFENAVFMWSREADHTPHPGQQFVLRIDGELLFKRGRINILLGETGSGKTSLLMALLSEMYYIPVGSTSWYNLPREGGVAYAAQESWVQNETIKENIVFGSPFDEERYRKVLYQCALERDISLFEAGDATEVGEKGVTLSGGQKARVTLARAIYSKASIILLDDVLAALDVHTAKWIVDKCLKGDLVKGRTVILVTHNVALVRPIAGFVATVKEGIITSQGNIEDALSYATVLKENLLNNEHREEDVVMDTGEPSQAAAIRSTKLTGKLIAPEETQVGHVTIAAVKSYFSAMGSSVLIGFVLGACLVAELIDATQTWFLGYWASQYADRNTDEVPVPWYLMIYSSFFVANVVIHAVGIIALIVGAIHASKLMHQRLLQSVLGTTLRWIDITPISRLITRFTQDIQAVDGPLVMVLKLLGDLTSKLVVKLLAIVVLTPAFFLPALILGILGVVCGQIHIKAQMSIKRERSNARAPVVGHVGSVIAGLVSIRAYGVQERVIQESMDRIDRYTRTTRAFYNLNRWISMRMDIVAGVLSSSLAAYLVYGQGQSALNTGFVLNMAIGFNAIIGFWTRGVNDFQVHATSLERLHAYSEIEQELKPTSEGKPPAYWPASGTLKVEKLSARYSPDGPRVLHDLSFEIRAGERIGVVGRTGSGKSSLTLSLLRCIFTEGKVYYDGISTESINLEALRASITIIPQMPELLSGTIRQNLDPFEQHDDAMLHSALRSAGLDSLQSAEHTRRLTLDSPIWMGGSNLSVGQRQIIALARALVRGSKLLILDEATSAIDYHTDSVIQAFLRKELPTDVTVITVAHRLQTIMDADKIVRRRMIEFDSPKALLVKEDGLLKSLVDESNDKTTLYTMASSVKGDD
ncbi:hypothetical protein AAF712_004404 [Marasmius tenuissimus]|uniref:P-loop containing nucleoside triphosphate hydrolase protein n=1 Tax=Marasmius tenuissimus TaxID=585030 RepID=A0ABR3A6R5_9AGAR